MSDNYHHGNLRNALIEEGIKMINAGGEESLSLRKVAAACGVSNAAPYAHFANKDEMIVAIKEFVSQKFYDTLKTAVDGFENQSAEAKILAMGNAYICFFIDNPDYFSFLFSKGYIHINLDLQNDDPGNFTPFIMLKQLMLQYFEETHQNISDDEKERNIIATWASVQGLTSIAFMKNVKWSKNWKDEIKKILR